MIVQAYSGSRLNLCSGADTIPYRSKVEFADQPALSALHKAGPKLMKDNPDVDERLDIRRGFHAG